MSFKTLLNDLPFRLNHYLIFGINNVTYSKNVVAAVLISVVHVIFKHNLDFLNVELAGSAELQVECIIEPRIPLIPLLVDPRLELL